MNHIEVEARYEIELEEYTKKIQIEGRVLNKPRNPTAIRYQNTLIENVRLKISLELNLKNCKRTNHFD
jgi:glutamine synthetase